MCPAWAVVFKTIQEELKNRLTVITRILPQRLNIAALQF